MRSLYFYALLAFFVRLIEIEERERTHIHKPEKENWKPVKDRWDMLADISALASRDELMFRTLARIYTPNDDDTPIETIYHAVTTLPHEPLVDFHRRVTEYCNHYVVLKLDDMLIPIPESKGGEYLMEWFEIIMKALGVLGLDTPEVCIGFNLATRQVTIRVTGGPKITVDLETVTNSQLVKMVRTIADAIDRKDNEPD